jgi:two-component system response regulator DesR
VPAARVAGIFAVFISLPAVIGLLGDEPSAGRVAAVATALVVFFAFFFQAVRGRLHPRPPAVVARAYVVDMVIAGALTVFDRPEWNLLFYYVVAMGALRLPRPWNVVVLPVTALTAGLTATAGGGNTSAAWGQALGLLGIGAAMVSMGEIMRTNRELVAARAEVARLAVADERERFARDLHDLLGHSLSVIALKAQLARKRLPHDPEKAAADVADIEAVTRDALREVRQTVRLPPPRARRRARGRADGARRGGDRRDDRPPAGRAAARRRGRPGLDGARGGDQRHPPQRRPPQRHPAGAGARRGDGGGRRRWRGRPRSGRHQRRGPRARRPGGARAPGRRPPRGGSSRRRPRLPGARGGAGRVGAVIRVLLAEDQAMVRGALAGLLSLEPDIEVVAQVARGDEVLEAALAQRPDVALLDIEMPGADGLEAAAQLRGELPGCKVLMLTTFGRPGYLRRAMEEGAAGFLLKDDPADELARAIRRAVRGERVVDPGLAAAALSEGPSPLTARERDVLAAARQHATVADIASVLHLSPGTVRNYLSAAMGKVGGRNRAEAIRAAEEKGWL